MSSLLLARAPRQAIPLRAMAEAGLKTWLAHQNSSLRRWVEGQRFSGKPGTFCVVPAPDGGVSCVLLGLSDPVSLWDCAALPFALPLGVYALEQDFPPEVLERLALGWLLGGRKLKSYKADTRKAAELALSGPCNLEAVERMAEILSATRDLITTPASELTPDAFAKEILAVGRAQGAKVSEIAGDALLKAGYPAIHAVGRASRFAPRLMDLRWGKLKDRAVTLVGKGVCFDTGGLSLKPSKAMTLMKKDMAGAAVALGVAQLIMRAKLPIRLRVLLPVVENAIGGNALRVSDVIQMRSGLSVEVTNTDAEGRLVVADALVEAATEKPDLILDFTTLGPARGIFGPDYAAFCTADDRMAEALLRASQASEDPLWRMPLASAYEPWLEASSVADLVNAPNQPYGGFMTSALFLQRFVGKKIPWVHFDFMAWNPSARPGRPEGGEAACLRAVARFLEETFRTK